MRSAIARLSGKLAGTRGRERRELIAAAHTVIVVAAFFEAFHEHVGDEFRESLEITEKEKRKLIAGGKRQSEEDLYKILYAAEVPAPSATNGFEENLPAIHHWYRNFIEVIEVYLRGLSTDKHVEVTWPAVGNSALNRYRSHFLDLAAMVPEFMIWALLNEGAATRSAAHEIRADMTGHVDALLSHGTEARSMIDGLRVDIDGLRKDMAAALGANRNALGRIAALLALDAVHDGAILDLRQSLARANSGVLGEKIVPEDTHGYVSIEFPTVGESCINPRYRVARAGMHILNPSLTDETLAETVGRYADDHWWDNQVSRDDFDLMLAAYVTSLDAARLPMLLLGHPGAGKSMLTKVFAARLRPARRHTVVRVSLRRVGANAPVRTQIETALADATNGRVNSWWQLAAQSADTTRVVLLDGLDELLQASQTGRSGYLQEVMEFQQHEAEQQQPVVVIVTSRTVVADRVDIPEGTTVVKLDFFDDSDIADWLDRWRRVNATAIAAGKMRELTLDSVLGTAGASAADIITWKTTDADADREGADYDKAECNDGEQDRAGEGRTGHLDGGIRELARQPLLLLMLALYTAIARQPSLDPNSATADLYQRLLESFCRREAAKALGPNPPRDQINELMQDHLDRLSTAALAMFNRGRQDISEEELGIDLAALDANLMERSRPVDAGQRIIGKFFFVHAPEARILTGPSAADANSAVQPSLWEPPRRSYEFLHATFGEYLVASRVMTELAEVAARAFAGRRGPKEPDDDLLYALLSHQALAARKSFTFAKEIFAWLPDRGREQVFEVIEILLSSCRQRRGSAKYVNYRPRPADLVCELAFYTANLVALRVTLEPERCSIPLTKLLHCPTGDVMDQWRSMVMLWRSGLDSDCMQAMLATV